jgi:hypothetical protein
MKPKVLYAILGATVTGFLVGWLIFGIVLDSFYKSQMTAAMAGLSKDPPDMWAIIIMNLCYASLLVYIFHAFAGITTFMKGFTAGIIIFFLIMAGVDFGMYAFMSMYSFTMLIVDIIANTILGGIVGGVAGLILGLGKKDTA